MKTQDITVNNKVVTLYPVHELVILLLTDQLQELTTVTRGLRYEGFRGAIFFEILALLKSRTRKDFHKGMLLSNQIRTSDLYYMDGLLPKVPNSESIIEAALWILNRELPDKHSTAMTNPAKRLQVLATLNNAFQRSTVLGSPEHFIEAAKNHGGKYITQSDITAFLIRFHSRLGNLKQAFSILNSQVRKQAMSPLITNAGHELFELVPHRKRMELMVYGETRGDIRQYAVAPIEGAGVIVKENLGASSNDQKLNGKQMSDIDTLAFTIPCTRNAVKDRVMDLTLKKYMSEPVFMKPLAISKKVA